MSTAASAARGTIAEALAKQNGRPRTLINASAIGFYGSRGDELLDETSSPGHGDFLSQVCQDWEAAATAPAANAAVRVVLARFGVILSGKGGHWPRCCSRFAWGWEEKSAAVANS